MAGTKKPFDRRTQGPQADPFRVDRLPPHSIEAEQGVLGCILWDYTTCLPLCESKMKSEPCFYDLRHQAIYDAMCSLSSAGKPVDLIVLQQELKDKQVLEQVGSYAYLSSLQDTVPSSANIEYYLDIVLRKSVVRKMIRTCSDIVARAYENDGDEDELLDEAERDVLAIRPEATEQRTWGQMLRGAITEIEERHNRGDAVGGLSTGLEDLDKKTDGMHGGEMIVVAAYPSVGKSALVGGIADHVAVNLNLPVGIFSMEMTGEEYAKRMISTRARVNLRDRMGDEHFRRMIVANAALSKAPIHIEDSGDMTIGQLRAIARRINQKQKVALWVVDYIQLLNAAVKDGNREQEVAAISKGLKDMAKEFRAPVIALSQLNDKGQLRESRSIGQDADCIWMLNRKEDTDSYASEVIELRIEKQRGGVRNVGVPLVFLKQFTRFECPAKISDEDVPKPYKDK